MNKHSLPLRPVLHAKRIIVLSRVEVAVEKPHINPLGQQEALQGVLVDVLGQF